LSVDRLGEERPVQTSADGGEPYRVDARGAEGVLVGEQSTQINYFY
jgi:hypothetical protein